MIKCDKNDYLLIVPLKKVINEKENIAEVSVTDFFDRLKCVFNFQTNKDYEEGLLSITNKEMLNNTISFHENLIERIKNYVIKEKGKTDIELKASIFFQYCGIEECAVFDWNTVPEYLASLTGIDYNLVCPELLYLMFLDKEENKIVDYSNNTKIETIELSDKEISIYEDVKNLINLISIKFSNTQKYLFIWADDKDDFNWSDANNDKTKKTLQFSVTIETQKLIKALKNYLLNNNIFDEEEEINENINELQKLADKNGPETVTIKPDKIYYSSNKETNEIKGYSLNPSNIIEYLLTAVNLDTKLKDIFKDKRRDNKILYCVYEEFSVIKVLTPIVGVKPEKYVVNKYFLNADEFKRYSLLNWINENIQNFTSFLNIIVSELIEN